MYSICPPFESQEKGGRALENSQKIRLYGIFYSDCKFANRICDIKIKEEIMPMVICETRKQ